MVLVSQVRRWLPGSAASGACSLLLRVDVIPDAVEGCRRCARECSTLWNLVAQLIASVSPPFDAEVSHHSVQAAFVVEIGTGSQSISEKENSAAGIEGDCCVTRREESYARLPKDVPGVVIVRIDLDAR